VRKCGKTQTTPHYGDTVVVSTFSVKNHPWSLGVLPEYRLYYHWTIRPRKLCREISRLIFCILLYTVIFLGVFVMGSRCSQEAVRRPSFYVRWKQGSHYIFCLKKKRDKQLPLMSALLIQISIHTGKRMIIIVGWVDTLMAIFNLIIFK